MLGIVCGILLGHLASKKVGFTLNHASEPTRSSNNWIRSLQVESMASLAALNMLIVDFFWHL